MLGVFIARSYFAKWCSFLISNGKIDEIVERCHLMMILCYSNDASQNMGI